jgi:group I intron endonuclease
MWGSVPLHYILGSVKMIIYKIVNIENNKIYIGKTSRELNDRKIEHLSDARVGSELPIHRAIRKYGEKSFAFETIDEADTEVELSHREVYWISKYNSYEDGYNASRGGDGAGAGENHHMYGKHGADNPNSIPVIQLSLNGEFIKRHDSATEGAKFVNGNRGNVTSCCIGNITNVYDSIWIYESNYNDLYVQDRVNACNEKMGRNAVVQLTKDGEFVQDYLTAKDGAIAIDGNGTSITACCKRKKKYKTYKGFIWIYKSDYENEEIRREHIERAKNRWKD